MVNKEAARSNDCVVPSHLCVCVLFHSSKRPCFFVSFYLSVSSFALQWWFPSSLTRCRFSFVCVCCYGCREEEEEKNPLLFPCRGKRGRGSTPSGRLVVSQCAALDPSVSVSTFLCTSAIVPNSFRMPCHHDPWLKNMVNTSSTSSTTRSVQSRLAKRPAPPIVLPFLRHFSLDGFVTLLRADTIVKESGSRAGILFFFSALFQPHSRWQ